MKVDLLFRTLLTLFFIGFAGCSSSPRTMNSDHSTTSATTRTAAQKSEAHNFVEIQFKTGSSELTDQAKSSLVSVLDQARADGKIEEVLVLSWSDKEYPYKSNTRLTSAQAELADKRNATIEKYIETMSYAEIDTYNMAKRPNVFSSLFNTSDTRMKNSFMAAGLGSSENKINNNGKASHTVVLVKVE